MAQDPSNAAREALFAGLAATMERLGSVEFPQLLTALLEDSSNYESTVIAAFPKSGRPIRLFSNLTPAEEDTTLRPYFDNTYLLDPWYNMARSRVPDGVYRLADHVPDGFLDSEYYQDYYAATGLLDECGVFVRLSERICLVAMLGIRRWETGAGQLTELVTLLPCLRVLVRKHWASLSTLSLTPDEDLQTMCIARGLAGREIEVTDRLLRGYSNKMIGRELGISHETVKVYRKRINRKLGTSSTREVFATFFRREF